MNMRERLARAISGAPFPSKAAYRKADAVLDELMTPTEGMRGEGKDEHLIQEADGGFRSDQAVAIFTAMIKAAKEGK